MRDVADQEFILVEKELTENTFAKYLADFGLLPRQFHNHHTCSLVL